MNERSKSLVDMIEELGAAAAAGLLDHAEAAQRLQQFSDGGLTRRGAEDMLNRWQSARASYQSIFQAAEDGLVRILTQQGEEILLKALSAADGPRASDGRPIQGPEPGA
ncbi:hypothetical protein [Nocardia sp. CNY236]|uniref:hypothetical protein n=1 Tax=Nocardia sp. CNY236 TaxID=1169152 RepID=UPI000417CE3C|nr:hypothetical protein [Nocardia sp. CNY236]